MTKLLPARMITGYALAKLLPGIGLFIAIPVWVRAFGEASYGMYAVAWTVTTATSSLCNGWIRQSALRYSGDESLAPRDIPPRVHALASTASVLPTFVILSSLQAQVPADLLVSALLLAAASTYYGTRLAAAQRYGQSTRYALAESARILMALALSLLFASFLPVSDAAAILSAFAVGTLVATALLSPTTEADRSAKQQDLLGVYWKYGWPMGVWLFLSSLLVYIDRVVVAAFLGYERAGAYAAVADLVVRGFAMATIPITMAAHPAIMRLWNAGRGEEALSAARRFAVALLAYTGFGMATLIIFGSAPLGWVLGLEVDRPVLAGLCLGAALWQVALMTHKPLEMSGRTKLMAVLIALSVLVNLVASVSLTPRYGEAATAAAFALGALTYLVTSQICGTRTIAREGSS